MMTKKLCGLSESCDNLEECVYLHEAWPQVRKWAVDKKVLDMDEFIFLAFFFWGLLISEGALSYKFTSI